MKRSIYSCWSTFSKESTSSKHTGRIAYVERQQKGYTEGQKKTQGKDVRTLGDRPWRQGQMMVLTAADLVP